ncbi:formate/nitrite transporter family protein [Altererythrobacter sp. SALINAS58]|uniref:formate/nitrite transporter family protein n=1 Tax=Alteripontixanthobacter muriae TaxID=2705546 RepID=UPI0015759058|nr:formate/nitrite transporter family protein [Alteripontixanthobacter muriae]NTZ43999.1 formate/nitrite transporter family protein [Alteripontixanthobacter muriae]
MSESDNSSPGTANDQNEAEENTSLSALVVHEAIRSEGKEELDRPTTSLAWSGLAAGLSMGLSFMGEGLLRASIPDAPWRGLLTSFGYTLGFLVVVLGRQQLFTENTLTAVVPVLYDRSKQTVLALLRLWSVVFVANIVGTLLFASSAALTDIFSVEAKSAFHEIGVHASQVGTWTTFVRAIAAGWLIGLMVWLFPAAGAARFFVIVTITYFIAVGELSHVVAGSAEVAYAAIQGSITWGNYLFGFLLPALAGNIIGGAVLVAAVNHAQVRDELR